MSNEVSPLQARFFAVISTIGSVVAFVCFLRFKVPNASDFVSVSGALQDAHQSEIFNGKGVRRGAFSDIYLAGNPIRYRVSEGRPWGLLADDFHAKAAKGQRIELLAHKEDVGNPKTFDDNTPTVFVEGVKRDGIQYLFLDDYLSDQRRERWICLGAGPIALLMGIYLFRHANRMEGR